MKGGINKIIRNINATKGKTDFEKVFRLHKHNKFLEID
jgi:hypothetical protein